MDLLDDCIAGLEIKLGLKPGESLANVVITQKTKKDTNNPPKNPVKREPQSKITKIEPVGSDKRRWVSAVGSAFVIRRHNENQPNICKLEFKVGQITKVWAHPSDDNLYCEEIDVGEGYPRQIASSLRLHFTNDQMIGQHVLVITNLKAKSMTGFKSNGMVLCAARSKEDGSEEVQFVEPPADAPIGEVVTYDGLPPPDPWSGAQVEKKKVVAVCMGGMKTRGDCKGAWNGHVFMTSAGPCKTKSIAGGAMR